VDWHSWHEDIERTVGTCCQLCQTGGTVIWTRERSAPDRVPLICGWFEERGFDRQWLSEPDAGFGVGVHRFRGEPQPLAAGQHLFTFTRSGVLRQAGCQRGGQPSASNTATGSR
jgi:hypothetical protein